MNKWKRFDFNREIVQTLQIIRIRANLIYIVQWNF